MKCSQCGGTEFTEKMVLAKIDVITDDGGGCDTATEVKLGDRIKSNPDPFAEHKTIENPQYIKACVCKKCGHIEFFVK